MWGVGGYLSMIYVHCIGGGCIGGRMYGGLHCIGNLKGREYMCIALGTACMGELHLHCIVLCEKIIAQIKHFKTFI